MLKNVQKGEKGFTLIEILVVVAIIGVLVAIAIPQFANYKKQAIDGAAESDIRGMAMAMESYYAAYNAYTADLALFTAAGFKATKNVATSVTLANAPATTFTISSYQSGGIKTFLWDSASGGLR